jgi:hypothetical protein
MKFCEYRPRSSMLSFIMLNLIMLNVIMLNVIMLSVFMANVVALLHCLCLNKYFLKSLNLYMPIIEE